MSSLHSYKSQVAVCRDLADALRRDIVQRPVSFQKRKCPFHRYSLTIKGLPTNGVLPYPESFHELVMGGVDLHDRLRPVEVLHELEEASTRIAFICHQIAGQEPRVCDSGLSQNVGCSLRVMDVARTDIGGNRKLRLAVNKQMQLPTQGKLSLAVGVLLDRPTGLSVSRSRLASVHPTFQGRAVQSHPLSEARDVSIVAAHQAARHIFQQRKRASGELGKEAAKCSLVRDGLWGLDAASSGDERIVTESAYHRLGRWQAEVVLDQEATPENVGGMALRASANRAYESFKKWGIVEVIKEGLKLCNDGWRLNRCASRGNISGDHGKPKPSCWLGAVGVNAPTAPSFLTTFSLLRIISIVKVYKCGKPTNCTRIRRYSGRARRQDGGGIVRYGWCLQGQPHP